MFKESLEIVCVDDEPLMLATYEEMMAKNGYRVVTFEKSLEALEYLSGNSKKVSLILCDYRMPDLNGLELKNKLTGELEEIPFALISGFLSRQKADEISSESSLNYFAKPFNPSELESFVRKTHTERIKSREEELLLIKSFAEEASPRLDEVDDLLLALEAMPLHQRREALIAIGRDIHTLKGAAACVSLTAIAHFCHDIETSLVSLNDPEMPLGELVAGLISALQQMRVMISDAPEKGDSIYDSSYWREVLAGRKVDVSSEESGKITEQVEENQRISLSLRDLNEFVETSGNLTILRNYLSQRIEILRERYPKDHDLRSIQEYMGEFHKENSMLQSRVSELKKISFVEILRPLKKMVRDLSGKVQKKARLLVEGEDTFIDYEMGKAVGGALMHLIRNSLDHGIEAPAERRTSGKPEIASIKINIVIKPDFLEIRLSDDGRGISVEKISKKLIERNLLTEAELKLMKSEDILKWIFHPGFSTAESISEISGRGIGMDMVKNMTEKFGGSINVKSEAGLGTEFLMELKVEKSSNIKPAISFDIGHGRIAVLCEDIIEIGKAVDLRLENRLTSVGPRHFLFLKGKQIEVLDLDHFLFGKAPLGSASASAPIVVSLKCRDTYFSFFASRTDIVEELLIKQLPKEIFVHSCVNSIAVSGRNGLVVLLDSTCLENISEDLEKPRRIN